MALTTCPECKEKIASNAKVCPHCGHVLSDEVNKKEKNTIVLLKRERVSYTLDILIMVLPLSLIALMLLSHYLLLLSIPLALLTLGWGIISIRKRKINNKINLDLINYDKVNKTLTCIDLSLKEYTFNVNEIIDVKKENLITQRVYLTYKLISEDHKTYISKKIDLGYAKSSDLKEFKSKLKNIIEVNQTVEE